MPARRYLLEQAISCDDADQAAKILQQALGIESDDVVNYTFPKTWPEDREQRARIIADRGRHLQPAGAFAEAVIRSLEFIIQWGCVWRCLASRLPQCSFVYLVS